MIRRHGLTSAFWGDESGNKEATGANGTSRPVALGQAVDQACVYVTVDGATTISVLTAHSNALTADGNDPDVDNPPATFMNLYYASAISTPVQYTFSGTGSAAIILPHFTPGWLQLKSSNNVNALAGFEVSVP